MGTLLEKDRSIENLVNRFQQQLNSKDRATASATVQSLKQRAKELDYFPVFQDLGDIIHHTLSDEKEFNEFSQEEMEYLSGLAAKFNDFGGGSDIEKNQEYWQKLNELKINRQKENIFALKYNDFRLKEILLPKNFNHVIKPRRHDKNKIGVWTIWAAIAEKVAIQNDGFLDDLIKISHDFSDLAFKYIVDFTTTTLYSNVFQLGDYDDLLDDITSVFKLFSLSRVKEGKVKSEELPGFLEKEVDKYFSYLGEEYVGWSGTKQMAFMVVSNRLAEENFMGVQWKKYNFESEIARRIETSVRQPDYYEKKGRAQELSAILETTSCLPVRMNSFSDKMMGDAVASFTSDFVRWKRINGVKGDYVLRLSKVLREEDSNFDIYMRQPYTIEAIQEAQKQGRKFAQALVRATTETHEGWRNNPEFKYEKGQFEAAIKEGFVARMNECNTPIQELDKIKLKLSSIDEMVKKEGKEGYSFWAIGDGYAVVYNIDSFANPHQKTEIFLFNGNVENLSRKAIRNIDPYTNEFTLLSRSLNKPYTKVLIKPLTAEALDKMSGGISTRDGEIRFELLSVAK